MAGAMPGRYAGALAAALLVLLQHQLLHPLLPHNQLLRVLFRQVGPEGGVVFFLPSVIRLMILERFPVCFTIFQFFSVTVKCFKEFVSEIQFESTLPAPTLYMEMSLGRFSTASTKSSLGNHIITPIT